MFAFAVWDGRKIEGKEQGSGTLFLARDRLGIKPLYYFASTEQGVESNGQDAKKRGSVNGKRRISNPQSAIRNSQFLFASEVRTLLSSGLVPKKLSPTAL